MKARGGWREKPLPDEEPAPVKTVISWMDEAPASTDAFPQGQKTIVRDIDYE